MSSTFHDTGHVRLVRALKALPRAYKDRVRAQLERIELCNHAPLGRTAEGYEPVRTDDGKVLVRGWHCNNPLCHKAAVGKAEKTVEKYILRAMTRVKFEYYALTFTSVPVVGESLLDAHRMVERARQKMLADDEFQRLVRGGLWRVEMTSEDRGTGRSWYVHMHVLADANLNEKRKKRLQWLWANSVVSEGGLRPTQGYAEPVEVMDAYIRYMRKEMDYSEWTHEELVEMCRFLMAQRAPVLMGAFGSWSDRTKEGRKYAEAKRVLLGLDPEPQTSTSPVKPDRGSLGCGQQIPSIDFTDIRIVTRKVKTSGREIILGIYPAVRGHGMEVENAAAAELVGASVGKFFRKMRLNLLAEQEFVGVHTGTVYKGSEILPQFVHSTQEIRGDHSRQAQDS